MRSCQGMGVEKVRKDDTARTFEFLFRFNRVWINSRLLLLLLLFLTILHWQPSSRVFTRFTLNSQIQVAVYPWEIWLASFVTLEVYVSIVGFLSIFYSMYNYFILMFVLIFMQARTPQILDRQDDKHLAILPCTWVHSFSHHRQLLSKVWNLVQWPFIIIIIIIIILTSIQLHDCIVMALP